MGFVYQNVPPFELKTGDKLAFDLAAPNDADIGLEIAMAPTLANGGGFGVVPTIPFTRVVGNTQIPAEPRGNAIPGDYELEFTAEAAFSFLGGGLIVRFSSPSAAYAADATCTGTGSVVGGAGSDAGGLFLVKYLADPDGACPCPPGSVSATGIAQFRLTLADPPPRDPVPPTPAAPAPAAPAPAPAARKNCRAKKRKAKQGKRKKARGCAKRRVPKQQRKRR
jgi:hypothetical protein